MAEKGIVYIIGAGPGDAGLITLKGVRCIARADVIVYDHLVNEEILVHAKPGARLIYAGKEGGDHTLVQDEINRILVEEARQGRVVARVKGGDPYIFGRGGEEALVVAAAGLPFEVVPGVSSAVAVPAYAGISLTQRGYTSTLAFVTGHEDPTKEQSDIDWKALAGIGTLVFLMGVKNLHLIVASLVGNGKKPETPAALIRWGTTPDQRTLAGTLGTIVELARERKFKPPAIFVVGEVVALREKLSWFENRPLFGRGVIITRPEAQAESFAALLDEKGARVVHFPVIRIAEPEDWSGLDKALDSLSAYAWIVFTSANGVRHFFERLRERGGDVRDLRGIRIATIGPASAAAVEGRGIRVDIVPEEYISEGVVKAFEKVDLKGARVLLPRAAEARDVIPEGLVAMGATVDVVTAYRTVRSEKTREELEAIFAEGKADVVTFTSPSTVRHFLDILGGVEALPAGLKVACIGPITAAAARKAGLPIHIHQQEYTIPGMVAAIEAHFSGTDC
jgi:uroporphyrinogen III methyltransferase/synthase